MVYVRLILYHIFESKSTKNKLTKIRCDVIINYHTKRGRIVEYKLIRSGRKTLAAEITREGDIIVRAPYRISKQHIEKFLEDNKERIERAVKRAKAHKPSYSSDAPEADELRRKAEAIIPEKVAYYAKIMNLEPKSVRITAAKKRFGSCSSRGTLCFSFNLMQYPEEAIDYVVVHELAHLVELNHSKKFWSVVEKYMPDYKKRRAILKE